MSRSKLKGAFSEGIVDLADATAITIDASENVGIGKTPTVQLDVDVGSSSAMSRFETSNTALARQYMYGGAASTQVDITFLQNNVLSGVFGVNPNTGDCFIDSRNGSGGDTVFYRTGSERMRILSSGGITFNGDTAAANALDDYEEGTWTPRYEALTTDFSSVTYIVQDGFYQKVGNTLHTWFRLRISSYTGSPAGLVVVAGWPFTPSGGVYQAGTVGYSTGWTNSPQNVYTQTNQGYAILSKDGSGGTTGIQIGDLNASGFNDIICSLSYKV